jgi:hypothetical protein
MCLLGHHITLVARPVELPAASSAEKPSRSSVEPLAPIESKEFYFREEEPAFKQFEKPWVVQSVFDLPFYSFYVGAPAIQGVPYLPNFAPRLGVRTGYRELSVMATFSLPISESEQRRRGNSEVFTGVLNSYYRANALDIYFQKYRGFYAASPFSELSINKPDVYPQLSDARILNYGLNWYRVLDSSKYSLQAAFDFSELQTVSGGSWIYNPFYNHFEISLGTVFLPGTAAEAPNPLNLSSGKFDTLGFAFGYGHTTITDRRFYSWQIVGGPGLQRRFLTQKDQAEFEQWSLAMKGNLNLAAGWSFDDSVFGVKLLVDTIWGQVQGTQIYSSLIDLQFFAGIRL